MILSFNSKLSSYSKVHILSNLTMPQFKSHKLNQGGVQEKYLQASSNFALPQFISKAKKTG